MNWEKLLKRTLHAFDPDDTFLFEEENEKPFGEECWAGIEEPEVEAVERYYGGE